MDLQSRILKRVPLEQPEMITQKQLAASICIQFGEYYLAEKEYAKAVQSYKMPSPCAYRQLGSLE